LKKKISKNWLNKQKRDLFFKKSKIEGFRSRSVYKLIEMNKKFNFLKKNSSVLDLGSYPGGWSQIIKKEIKTGKILSVDIKPMQDIENVDFIKGDFSSNKTMNEIITYFKNKADVVLSDIAVSTTGNKSLDSFRTGELCIASMNLAIKILSSNGVFLSKLFMGSIFDEINKKAKENFKKVVIYKPLSSKKESKEIYIFCKGVLKI
jgi:23S rRNA (uridine2552-2'-O)-methyltransferase